MGIAFLHIWGREVVAKVRCLMTGVPRPWTCSLVRSL